MKALAKSHIDQPQTSRSLQGMRAFTCVPETRKNTHCGSYLMPEEAAKAHKHACIYPGKSCF